MTAVLHDLGRDDLVPASSVDDLIAAVQRQLDDLGEQLRHAQAAADAAELRALEATSRVDDHRGDLLRLREAVEVCAAAGRSSLDRAVEAARAEAAARRAEAHAQAATLLARAGRPVRTAAVRVDEPTPAASDPEDRAPAVEPPPGGPSAPADPDAGGAEEHRYDGFWAAVEERPDGPRLALPWGRWLPSAAAAVAGVVALLGLT